MRHRRKTHKLSRNAASRKALLRSLVRNLFIHEQISTTHKKAKAASSLADKLISLGKANTITAKKHAISVLGSKELINKIFDDIAPRFAKRSGGYTRVLRLATRHGDGATTAVLELTERRITEKKEKEIKKKKVSEETKAAPPKKDEKVQQITIATKEKVGEEKIRERAKNEREKMQQQGFLKGLRGYFRRKSG